MVWARADRPSRMLVEAATTDSFKDIHSAVAIDALPESDFTAKALLEGLPAGQDIFYRVASVHSGEDVVLTATGPGSERVHGQMDNTEVFRVMAEALGLGQVD